MNKKNEIGQHPLAARMAKVIRETWNAVGGDFSEMCGGSCNRAEMMEAIFDANRFSDYGNDKLAAKEIQRTLDANKWGSKAIDDLFSLAFPRR